MQSNSHLPDGWRQVRVEDVANVNPKRPTLHVEDDALVTFVPMAAVGERCSGILAQEERAYHEVSRGYTYFEDADVLFAKITPCVQNGKHALASDLLNGIGFGTTEFHVVRAGPDIEPRHLFRVLTQPQNIEKCVRSFSGTAGQQRVQPDVLKSLRLFLPPLHEQRAIAAILDSIDEAIERAEEVIAATERLRNALLHDLLTRGLPGHHTEWKEVRGLGTIPASWDVVRLGDACERITKGTTPTTLGHSYAPEGVRFLRVENVNGGSISGGEPKFVSEETHQFLGRSILQADDILLSIAGALGRTALVHEENLPANVNQALAIIRLQKTAVATPSFITLALGGDMVQRQVDDMRAELAQANINLEQVGDLRLPLPSRAEQQGIATLLDCTDTAIKREHEKCSTLKLLRSSAADALLAGTARLSDLHENLAGSQGTKVTK